MDLAEGGREVRREESLKNSSWIVSAYLDSDCDFITEPGTPLNDMSILFKICSTFTGTEYTELLAMTHFTVNSQLCRIIIHVQCS